MRNAGPLETGCGVEKFIRLDKPERRHSFASRLCPGDRDGLGPGFSTAETLMGVTMKTILALTAVLLVAGCEKKAATPASDTSAMAPAMSDTGMGMTHSDSTMARDTARK
jgi:hypothetical protein